MGYELYTVPSTLSHAQHLMESYYSLPYLAVDTVTIHDDPYVVGGDIGTPTLEIVRSGEETGTTMETNETVYEIEDPDKGWPLAKDEALQRAYENADIEVSTNTHTHTQHNLWNDIMTSRPFFKT